MDTTICWNASIVGFLLPPGAEIQRETRSLERLLHSRRQQFLRQSSFWTLRGVIRSGRDPAETAGADLGGLAVASRLRDRAICAPSRTEQGRLAQIGFRHVTCQTFGLAPTGTGEDPVRKCRSLSSQFNFDNGRKPVDPKADGSDLVLFLDEKGACGAPLLKPEAGSTAD